MVKKTIEVINPSGLHLRPAGMLCQTAMKFKCGVTIRYKEKEINAKSVLNIMASGIKCGTMIDVECDGADEEEALEAVCDLIQFELKD